MTADAPACLGRRRRRGASLRCGAVASNSLVKVNDIGAHHIPHPCKFIDPALPNACVVRPATVPNGGAVHLIGAGIKSGLFKGQTKQFLDTVMGLATAADAATRTLGAA